MNRTRKIEILNDIKKEKEQEIWNLKDKLSLASPSEFRQREIKIELLEKEIEYISSLIKHEERHAKFIINTGQKVERFHDQQELNNYVQNLLDYKDDKLIINKEKIKKFIDHDNNAADWKKIVWSFVNEINKTTTAKRFGIVIYRFVEKLAKRQGMHYD